ncbi:SIR2 family protein [Clostridium tertium]|jgi:Sir2- and TIR-associating SLOG family/SIR2-like domain|uniref:SIR2 family protein n=1 Tax=Clostridium tertium TaxID=1559 RepID=UPI00115A8820|nr:SIR2 family protein [Clostridium tertium]
MSVTKKTFITKYVKSLKEGNAAIFAGAGLSVGAGYVDWKSLLKDLAEEIELDINKEEHDLVGVAQYYCNEKNGRGVINQIIIDEFKTNVEITENHRILSRLPIQTFWTTNYDTLIEDSLRAVNKIVDIKIEEANLAITLPNRDSIVYKMHGDVSQVQKAVITRDDYERYSETHLLFTTALKGDLVSKTFLFVGFSFNDPNLNYILSRIRIGLEGNQRPHYCIFKKVSKEDFDNEESYIHAKVKQELQINDLKRYSINTIFVDSYDEITEILREIELEFKKSNVFISGSAVEYGIFSEYEAGEFLHDLSYQLVENKYKVISGFGLGVGSYIINGVLQYSETKKHSNINEILLLKPFPQKESGGVSLPTLWNKYRRDMISDSGVAIFIFGNKYNDNGEIINAGGLQNEFNIAKESGVKIIPIGITGYQTNLIYNELMNNFEQYYPENLEVKPLFEELSKLENKYKLVEIILEIISKL